MLKSMKKSMIKQFYIKNNFFPPIFDFDFKIEAFKNNKFGIEHCEKITISFCLQSWTEKDS